MKRAATQVRRLLQGKYAIYFCFAGAHLERAATDRGEIKFALRFVQPRDVGGDHVLCDRLDIDPFKLDADPSIWKADQIGVLFIGFRSQAVTECLCGALKRKGIECHR